MTAADRILQKALVGSPLDTAGWSKIQADIRDRAFFSATVEDLRVVGAMRDNVVQILQSGKSPSEVRRDLREYFHSIGVGSRVPRDRSGGTPDPTIYSKARLDVMMRTNCDMARGYVSHLRATTPGAMMAFPAYELVRVEDRKIKRDWHARWAAAASRVAYEGVANGRSGRMIALKTSPIWPALSRFGDPFPPFDFNSGMGVRDVAKSVCREIGLLRPDEQPEIPPKPDFNANLTYEARIQDNSLCADIFRDRFGDQVKFDGNRFHFVSELMRDVFNGRVRNATLGVGFNGKKTSVSRELVSQHVAKHIGENETHGGNIPLTENDFELLPSLWRNPSRHYPGKQGHTMIELDVVDGSRLVASWDDGRGLHTIYKTKVPKGAE